MWPHGNGRKIKVHISFQETEQDKSLESHPQKSVVKAFYLAMIYFRNNTFSRECFSVKGADRKERNAPGIKAQKDWHRRF